MRTYEITYSILPAGVGPDDYEPHELEQRTGQFEFPDPGPEDHYELLGKQYTYGPSHAAMYAAIQPTLQEGEQPIIDIRKLRKIS